MPQIADVRNPQQRYDFVPQKQATVEFGNRQGKKYESGVIRGPGWEEAAELFTRTVDAEEYADVWKLFDDAGLPVSPELWTDEDGKIYMPNLTADGSAFYGKGFVDAYALKQNKMDNNFLNIIDKKFDEITEVAGRLADHASKQGVLLPLDDAFDLHVFPDGSYELSILDLEYGGTLEDLLQRKERFSNQRTRGPLELHFQGKSIEQLNAMEKQQLVAYINESSKKSALTALKEAARRIRTGA